MGGPLVCQDSQTSPFVLHGIASYGLGCAFDGSPSVYTRVSNVIDGIDTVLNDPVGTYFATFTKI